MRTLLKKKNPNNTLKGKVLGMRNFINRNKEELVMLFLAFLGSSILGIFALSHLYGVINVLMSILLGFLLLLTIVILYYKFLSQRLYIFSMNKFAILEKKYFRRLNNRPKISKWFKVGFVLLNFITCTILHLPAFIQQLEKS